MRPTIPEVMEPTRAEWEEKGRAIVIRQLSMMDRSRYQLDEAMAKRGVPEDVRFEILDRYTEIGLIDDAHFADMLVRTRLAGAGTSRRVIVDELRRKGIDAGVIEDAVGQIDDVEELEAATRLAVKRIERGGGNPETLQKRAYAALARRGFSHDVCSAALRRANDLVHPHDDLVHPYDPAADDTD